MIKIFVGYDEREAVAYHAFCQSVIERASEPVQFIPLAKNMLGGFDGQRDGSNAFIYSRFLIPSLMGFKGWAIFADGDMICKSNIAELWALRNPWMAVHVVKHDYKTKHPVKYLGAKNESYERKNWSSLILWNCEHFRNRQLSSELVSKATGADLHRFTWLPDDRIGELPLEWNWLDEYGPNPNAKLVHHTLGIPVWQPYKQMWCANEWQEVSDRANYFQPWEPDEAFYAANGGVSER